MDVVTGARFGQSWRRVAVEVIIRRSIRECLGTLIYEGAKLERWVRFLYNPPLIYNDPRQTVQRIYSASVPL